MKIDLINTTCSELALILQAESNLHADFPRPDLDLQKRSFYLSNRIMNNLWSSDENRNLYYSFLRGLIL